MATDVVEEQRDQQLFHSDVTDKDDSASRPLAKKVIDNNDDDDDGRREPAETEQPRDSKSNQYRESHHDSNSPNDRITDNGSAHDESGEHAPFGSRSRRGSGEGDRSRSRERRSRKRSHCDDRGSASPSRGEREEDGDRNSDTRSEDADAPVRGRWNVLDCCSVCVNRDLVATTLSHSLHSCRCVLLRVMQSGVFRLFALACGCVSGCYCKRVA